MKHAKLFILSNGKIAAINKKDGSISWEIKSRMSLRTLATLVLEVYMKKAENSTLVFQDIYFA